MLHICDKILLFLFKMVCNNEFCIQHMLTFIAKCKAQIHEYTVYCSWICNVVLIFYVEHKHIYHIRINISIIEESIVHRHIFCLYLRLSISVYTSPPSEIKSAVKNIAHVYVILCVYSKMTTHTYSISNSYKYINEQYCTCKYDRIYCVYSKMRTHTYIVSNRYKIINEQYCTWKYDVCALCEYKHIYHINSYVNMYVKNFHAVPHTYMQAKKNDYKGLIRPVLCLLLYQHIHQQKEHGTHQISCRLFLQHVDM